MNTLFETDINYRNMMNLDSLARKLMDLLPELGARGAVYFFALGDRQDVPWWDVILSSAWSEPDTARYEARKLLVNILQERLTAEEFRLVSGVVIVPSSEPGIQFLPVKSLAIFPPDEAQSVHLDLLGQEIRRAYIFKAQRPPRAEEAGVSKLVAA